MPVIAADLVTYKTAGMPGYQDNASASGGTIDVASGAVPENTVNAVMPTEQVPDADEVWRYKLARKNTNGADTLYHAVVWILNGMNRTHTSGLASVQCTGASESGKIMLVGKVGGVWDFEYVTLDGTTNVISGAKVWDANTLRRAEKLSAGGAITTAIAPINISRGALLGFIPAGRAHATGEFELGLDLAQSSNLAATNRLTNPAGVTFALPTLEGAALAVPGTDIAAGAWIGYWLRFTRYAGIIVPVGYTSPIVRVKGQDAA